MVRALPEYCLSAGGASSLLRVAGSGFCFDLPDQLEDSLPVVLRRSLLSKIIFQLPLFWVQVVEASDLEGVCRWCRREARVALPRVL